MVFYSLSDLLHIGVFMAIKVKEEELAGIAKSYGMKHAYKVNLGDYSIIIVSDNEKPQSRAAILDQIKNPENVILRGKDLKRLDENQVKYAARRYLSTFSENEKKEYYTHKIPTKIKEMPFTLVVSAEKPKSKKEKEEEEIKEKIDVYLNYCKKYGFKEYLTPLKGYAQFLEAGAFKEKDKKDLEKLCAEIEKRIGEIEAKKRAA